MSGEGLDLELRGRTWHVYWYMLSKGSEQEVTVFQRVETQVDFALLLAGFAIIVILTIQTTRGRQETRRQRGEPDSADSRLEGIVTVVAIGLLLFTSMLSGPYLILVPMISIALIIIKLRR